CRVDGVDAPVVVRCAGRAGVATGQAVGLDWDDTHQHFFDPASGLRWPGVAPLSPSQRQESCA
ncbi:MAG: hypothetical protein ACRC4O_10990, partial [Giesbergeria sp.]